MGNLLGAMVVVSHSGGGQQVKRGVVIVAISPNNKQSHSLVRYKGHEKCTAGILLF